MTVTNELLLPSTARRLVKWGQLYGAATAWRLSEAAARIDAPLLVVAPNAREMSRFEDELRFFAPPSLKILTLPGWETLPYDVFSPHPDIVSQRLRLLASLPQGIPSIVVVELSTLLQRLAPRNYIDAHAFAIKQGQKLDLEPFRARLVAAGYAHATQVMAPGEFAVRGSLLDLFPMGSETPFRIDLFDTDIDSIRIFDPETQRSGERVNKIAMLPAREFPLDVDGVTAFKRRFRTRFEGDLTRMSVYRDIAPGTAPPGIEYFLPLFFDKTATLFDYLPHNAVITADVEWHDQAAHAWLEIESRHTQRAHDTERPILTPAELFLDPAQLAEGFGQFNRIEISRVELDPLVQSAPHKNYGTSVAPRLRIDARGEEPAAELVRFLREFSGRVLIAAESAGRREMLLDMLRKRHIDAPIVDGWHAFAASTMPLALTVSPLTTGLLLKEPPLAVIAEEQLFGERARQERRRRSSDRNPDRIIRDLSDLRIGSPVVHEEYGVGRYLGLMAMEVGGMPGEFLVLEYAGGDKVYVPVQALDLINRYSGTAAENAPLHKLGTDTWSKAKRKAALRIRDTAAELLDLYSRRAARPGVALAANDTDLRAFTAAFPFEETPDQAEAIQQTIADMQSNKPMDRVICGDVGFGKTEVAMRAAFVAVQAGKQVAVLVPTTLLAQQHSQSFADRFADWPIRVESMSRFRSTKEMQATTSALEAGTADIVIGTHRLLQGNVRFKNLGLVILDEEHRFGVKDKEKLKELRAEVDVLTLTATPIPRTLNMAMGGLRDLSLITTPPPSRLAIKTFVSQWDSATVREACLRELRRGGQIYYLHNSVDTIQKTATTLAELLPEARIAIGHGQMRERELEQVMLDFYHQRCNLLLCTTIVESGIDVPNANTIIIDRADKLGLAQLHQLRGRVGRSHHQAYAYLLTPPRNLMTADAVKRLEAIESLEDLGAGFTLATHDLEIRGAGELLGEEQSGQMQEIGFALYMEMLERAVKAIKEGKTPALDAPLHQGPEVNLHIPALIPADYMPDVHLRLTLYKRIAAAPDVPSLRELQVELIDRFGLLPEHAKNLFAITELKLQAKELGLRKVDVGPGGGSVTFDSDTRVAVATLLRYVQANGKTHRFDGPNKIRFVHKLEKDSERFAAAEKLMAALK